MSLVFDEYGRPFIILREQQAQNRLKGLEAQKVRRSRVVLCGGGDASHLFHHHRHRRNTAHFFESFPRGVYSQSRVCICLVILSWIPILFDAGALALPFLLPPSPEPLPPSKRRMAPYFPIHSTNEHALPSLRYLFNLLILTILTTAPFAPSLPPLLSLFLSK